jgi:hypothetical protein
MPLAISSCMKPYPPAAYGLSFIYKLFHSPKSKIASQQAYVCVSSILKRYPNKACILVCVEERVRYLKTTKSAKYVYSKWMWQSLMAEEIGICKGSGYVEILSLARQHIKPFSSLFPSFLLYFKTLLCYHHTKMTSSCTHVWRIRTSSCIKNPQENVDVKEGRVPFQKSRVRPPFKV